MIKRTLILTLPLLLVSVYLVAQQADIKMNRSPEGLAVLQKAVSALGGVPQDLVATGVITEEAGGKSESGTISITSVGLAKWNEKAILAAEQSFSRVAGIATERSGGVPVKRSLEWLASGQTPYFPTPLLEEALRSDDFAVELLSPDPESKAIRLQLTNTFKSSAGLRDVAAFTRKEIVIDPITYIPRKILYERRASSGAEGSIPTEVRLNDYRDIGGIQYPHHIEVLMNGTHWRTVKIESVVVNSGSAEVTDAR